MDGIAIIDCDIPGIPDLIESATGQKLPNTFTVLSAARRCPHLYYTHTEKSRALGNRSLPGKFDFKANNSYVVGPGSVLSTDGGPRSYDVANDAPIAPMPDWLCDWIAGVTEAAKNIESRDRRSVAENFDMGAFLAHYGLGYTTKGPWFITDVCPIAGRKHEQSSTTGFYYDGLSLGFKCFASSCPGSTMSVGEVIKHLNKSDGTVVVAPYTGEIWPKHEPAIDPEVAGADWFEPLSSFRARPIAPRKKLLRDFATSATVLYSESVNQVFAQRGLGKSLFTLGLINCLANGGKFLRYESEGGMKVLHCDGELPESLLQKRMDSQISNPERIVLMHAGSLPNQSFPKLSEPQWQSEFIKRIEVLQPDVIVFDTLTACFRFDTNDNKLWDAVNQFYITLRRKGYCVIVIHHAGKNGTQRGITNGDDNLDLSIKLNAASGWAPGDGCKFNLTYEKVREGDGKLVEFSALLDEQGKWVIADPAEDPEYKEVIDLYMQGKTVRDIERATSISRSSVARWIKKAIDSGMVEARTATFGSKKKKGKGE
jgi:putative DNA primase/helicase